MGNIKPTHCPSPAQRGEAPSDPGRVSDLGEKSQAKPEQVLHTKGPRDMIHIVRYWLPAGKLYKEPFRTAEAAIERYLALLAAGHKNLKLYTQHSSDTDE